MDETNRRLTLKLLTDGPPIVNPGEDSRQFFILTPKLLHDLECVFFLSFSAVRPCWRAPWGGEGDWVVGR
jgi:hypothetical protein